METIDTLDGYNPRHANLVAYRNPSGGWDTFDGTAFLGVFSGFDLYVSNLRVRMEG